MATLYILCGPSGSGKSTWAHSFMNEKSEDDIRYVSRDEIRYSLLQENDEYFAREKEVYRKFVATIANTLIDGFDVIADATHLNYASRRKLMQALDMYTKDYAIVYVVFTHDAEVCLEHNSNREGRANVPETVIRNMCRDFRMPEYDDDDRVVNIIEVEENG